MTDQLFVTDVIQEPGDDPCREPEFEIILSDGTRFMTKNRVAVDCAVEALRAFRHGDKEVAHAFTLKCERHAGRLQTFRAVCPDHPDASVFDVSAMGRPNSFRCSVCGKEVTGP